MNLALSQLFTAEQLTDLQQQLSQLKFVDGASTAGWHAKLVKKNLQADAKDELTQKLTAGIREALLKHPLVQTALLPRRIRMPLISKYEPGMEYGAHVDNALMGGATLTNIRYGASRSGILGYWIGACDKMAYKDRFRPFEILLDGRWQRQD